MAEVDDRGRIYVPKKIREEFGRKFRIVELENSVKLIPISENPLEGLKKAVEAGEIEIDQVDNKVEEKVREELK